jgi:WXG100 family type VII secretion target
MGKAAQQVEQVSQQLQQLMRSLESQLEPMASQWKGAAASAFQNLINRFGEDSQKLTTALGNISEALAANSKNYSAAETQNQSSIQGILGALGG